MSSPQSHSRGQRGALLMGQLERVLPHATTSPTLSQAGTQPLDPTALSPPCLPTPGWMGPPAGLTFHSDYTSLEPPGTCSGPPSTSHLLRDVLQASKGPQPSVVRKPLRSLQPRPCRPPCGPGPLPHPFFSSLQVPGPLRGAPGCPRQPPALQTARPHSASTPGFPPHSSGSLDTTNNDTRSPSVPRPVTQLSCFRSAQPDSPCDRYAPHKRPPSFLGLL
ncbi:unnamed protein product [Rangifer tarandus platyrhynchus]|uniref:Uncharacterized protein n=1 Tax=Rangifer tarandus platyrhynchus TaxID=3082113 RepID=A0ABN8ZFR7_RANTA|nr:unnamed protein product [Rangifer tarandus platyrhynchus]